MIDFNFEELKKIISELNIEVERIKLSDIDVKIKEDLSPLTKADVYVNAKLCDFVKKTSVKNIISEEQNIQNYNLRSKWDKYWIIDPIDGTKEFIKKSSNYTINIALCQKSKPIFGIVSRPATNDIYYAFKNGGAYLNGHLLKTEKQPFKKIRIVASSSHINQQTESFIKNLSKKGPIEIKNYGSSLKICKIAEGEADIYPRFAPTMEWDTCAAQIILEESGGTVTDIEMNPLSYNKKNLVNPFFIAQKI
tara:strand:+ start:176 stop:925 length:750 start_codon:yes stop_codon:yes gene_type:complete